jgi:hypothetical protein
MILRKLRGLYAHRFLNVGVILVATVAMIFVTASAAQTTKPLVRPFIASLPPKKQSAVPLQETKTTQLASAHPEWRHIPPTVTRGPEILGIQYKYQNAWNIHQRFENEWFGYIDGQYMAVFAGHVSTVGPGGKVTEDEDQGYVAVGTGSEINGPDRNYHEYLTPTKHGGLKITAVNGTQVSLVAEDGTMFTFDLATRTFS